MSLRLLQGATIAAGVGSVLMLLGVLGTTVNLIGLGLILLAVVLTAPAARADGSGWWSLLATGAVLSAVGALLSIATDAVGGLVTLIGGVIVLAAAAFGFPSRR